MARGSSDAMIVTRLSRMALAAAVLAAVPAASTGAQDLNARDLASRVGIEQMLGATVPADLPFVDESGRPVTIGTYLGDRPVVLSLVYYECPMLCGVAMEGLVSNLKVLGLDVGVDFDIVNVSINPRETPDVAARKKADYLGRLGDPRPEVAAGWHTLTGSQESIDALAAAVGFRYVYDASIDEYAHGAAIMVMTPDGTLSRYYYGVEYPARDLRLGLVEAAAGTIGTITDQVLLLCYQYDPLSGKYSFMVWSAIRLAGMATLLGLLTFIVLSLRRERAMPPEAIAAAGGSYERK